MNFSSFNIQGSDGKIIPIDRIPSGSQTSSPLVIFVHGFKGFKDWGTHHLTARYFAQNGFSFLKFNFSHAGITARGGDVFDDLDAFSRNTFSKELFDLDQVITFALSGKEFDAPGQLFLIGHSLGGGISIIQAAEDHRISKLATWASISSFRNLWTSSEEEAWRRDGVLYRQNTRTNQQMPLSTEILDDLNHHSERLDILAAARTIEQSWLIVHGKADTGVHPAHAEELSRQNQSARLLLVPGADHVFGAKHPWHEDSLPPLLKKVCDDTINFFRN